MFHQTTALGSCCLLAVETQSLILNDCNLIDNKHLRYKCQHIPSAGQTGSFSLKKMGDLQATLELLLEFNKFYNVDLFQRG